MLHEVRDAAVHDSAERLRGRRRRGDREEAQRTVRFADRERRAVVRERDRRGTTHDLRFLAAPPQEDAVRGGEREAAARARSNADGRAEGTERASLLSQHRIDHVDAAFGVDGHDTSGGGLVSPRMFPRARRQRAGLRKEHREQRMSEGQAPPGGLGLGVVGKELGAIERQKEVLLRVVRDSVQAHSSSIPCYARGAPSFLATRRSAVGL